MLPDFLQLIIKAILVCKNNLLITTTKVITSFDIPKSF
jgi:hypothetical protein